MPAACTTVPPPASEPRRLVETARDPIAAAEASAVADAGVADERAADERHDGNAVSPAPRRGSARHARPSRLLSPSIVALAAVAACVWAAAWRNDRLRLEAARQQRPERLAQELPATAGPARSLTP